MLRYPSLRSAARYSVSGLLHRADGRRSGSGNLGQRQDQGLSAVVLGRAAGAAGQGPLSQRSRQLFRIHLSAAVGGAAGDPELFRQDPALSLPVVPQHRRVVDDGAIFARDGGVGAKARSVAGSAAGLRHRHLRVRHVRSRTAEPRAAGADAVRILAAARSARLDGGKHVRARHRHQGVSGGGVSLSGLAPAMGGCRQHAGLSRSCSCSCCRRRSAASSTTLPS